MGSGSGAISGYTYSAAIMAGIANGPIAGIGTVWLNKDKSTLAAMNMKVALGTLGQSPWGYLETKHPEEAIAYPGLAYVATPEMFLGRSSAELPNLSFEVYGRMMSKVVLEPGGDLVWVDRTAAFYFYHAEDDLGFLPKWDLVPKDSVEYEGGEFNGYTLSALSAKITFAGGSSPVSVKVYPSEEIFSVASGEAFDVSGLEIRQLTVEGTTGLVVSAIQLSTETTAEVAYYQSSVPGKLDADPAEIVEDFLTNELDGAGFDPSKLGSLADYSDYCVAAGLLLSPAFDQQKAASEYLKEILAATNSEAVPSQGLLKIIPYGDLPLSGNGRTYTPDVTPLYYLDDDHFLSTGEDPVTGSRITSADAFNHVQIEIVNRSKDYNVEIIEAKDQADIEAKGLRTMDVVQMHHICDPDVGRLVAQLLLQRVLYVRNTYKFKLSWNYVLLEPMDIVAITDPGLGLFAVPVRIKRIDEDEDDRLEFTVEEIPPGISTAQNYAAPPATGYITDSQADPGDATAPIIFEPPDALCETPGRPELWIAAAGGPNWGGCEVWISTNGETYGSIGFLYGKSRMGELAADLATGSSPDTVNHLKVDLSESGAALLPGNLQDAETYQTLCYVDGEYMAYRDARLIAASNYQLDYLVRGVYGSIIAAHATGSRFLRLDDKILRFAYPPSLIGREVSIKLTSFNLYGKKKQSLADVPTY